MRNAIALLAGVLTMVAVIPYLIDIVKGRTKPNIVSWLTWELLLVVATAGAFAAHEPRTALLTLGDLIGTGLTLLLGIKYGIAKFSWFDGLCQAGAVAGLVLWLVFDSPTLGIVAVLAVDAIGSLPTMKHSWQKPGEETWQTFAVIAGASGLTLLSLSNYTMASLAYPVYLLVANAMIVGIVVLKRRHSGISLARHSVHETLHE